ncbi:hypothetical protein EJ05DRAFT_417025, partial [Pseudovirgaria hyperparasitica]
LVAVQAGLSVLLVISYGVLAARFKLLDQGNAKAISKICVRMFLPALLITKLGAEIEAERVGRYGIVLAWAVFCHFVSFLMGVSARRVFGLPKWVTVAVMFNNTTSYPLLLMQSLSETGILSSLLVTDETTTRAIERAKSYFLVFATVSSCLTFAVGPRLVSAEATPEPDDKETHDEEAVYPSLPTNNPSEGTSLLSKSPARRDPCPTTSLLFHHPSEAYYSAAATHKRWLKHHPNIQWTLLFLYDFLNAPLLGALAGTLIGLTPPLKTAFFAAPSDGGFLRSWLTASWENIGRIFVPLPLVIAGVSLYYSIQTPTTATATTTPKTPTTQTKPLWHATSLILLIRFLAWPALSIPAIYILATRTQLLGSDPMLWFAMMVMPAGPPAMKLITMVQVSSGADEQDEFKIARVLTASYIVSPVFALTVIGALKASQAAI